MNWTMQQIMRVLREDGRYFGLIAGHDIEIDIDMKYNEYVVSIDGNTEVFRASTDSELSEIIGAIC